MPARKQSLLSRPGRVSPEQLQHDFYTAAAGRYDEIMVGEEADPHNVALEFISALTDGYGYGSVLDVGTGTGRGVKHFLARHPGVEVRGVEPVRAMIDRAESTGVPEGLILEASGAALPFGDDSFDIVCELGILHHVPNPDEIVREMTRVARRGVFLSDANRFAGGGRLHRAAKYALYRLGLWPLAYRLANRGRSYHYSGGEHGDGVVYSYSVYDSLPILNEWADRTFVVPTIGSRAGWFHPLFGAINVLGCALRDG